MLALAWIQLAAALASALAAWFLLKSRSKPAQDLDARELTPLRIREFFQRTRKEIRAYCALLEETRDHAEKALAALDAELAGQVPPPAQAAARRAALAESLRPVQAELKRIRHQCDYPDLFLVKFPRLEPEAVAKLEARHESLRGQLSLPPAPRPAGFRRPSARTTSTALTKTRSFPIRSSAAPRARPKTRPPGTDPKASNNPWSAA